MAEGMVLEAVQTRPHYGRIFIILAVFTAIEVGVSYLPPAFKIPVLILIALVKASLVALYFMHLRFDSRLYAFFFILGAVMVIPLVLMMTLVMPLLR